MIQQYPNVFTGIGKLDGTVKIDLWDDAAPYQEGPQWVAYVLQKSLHDGLDRLIKNTIITPLEAEEKSEWCILLICVNKLNVEVRLCNDPSKLNNQIIWPVYNSWWLEDILPKLTNAKYFSILDVKSGYWSLELDENSSYLTTFCYMYGWIYFFRLPFRLSCSSDIFQYMIDNLFHYLEIACSITDDMLAWCYEADGPDHHMYAEEILQWCDQKISNSAWKSVSWGEHTYLFMVL